MSTPAATTSSAKTPESQALPLYSTHPVTTLSRRFHTLDLPLDLQGMRPGWFSDIGLQFDKIRELLQKSINPVLTYGKHELPIFTASYFWVHFSNGTYGDKDYIDIRCAISTGGFFDYKIIPSSFDELRILIQKLPQIPLRVKTDLSDIKISTEFDSKKKKNQDIIDLTFSNISSRGVDVARPVLSAYKENYSIEKMGRNSLRVRILNTDCSNSQKRIVQCLYRIDTVFAKGIVRKALEKNKAAPSLPNASIEVIDESDAARVATFEVTENQIHCSYHKYSTITGACNVELITSLMKNQLPPALPAPSLILAADASNAPPLDFMIEVPIAPPMGLAADAPNAPPLDFMIEIPTAPSISVVPLSAQTANEVNRPILNRSNSGPIELPKSLKQENHIEELARILSRRASVPGNSNVNPSQKKNDATAPAIRPSTASTSMEGSETVEEEGQNTCAAAQEPVRDRPIALPPAPKNIADELKQAVQRRFVAPKKNEPSRPPVHASPPSYSSQKEKDSTGPAIRPSSASTSTEGSETVGEEGQNTHAAAQEPVRDRPIALPPAPKNIADELKQAVQRRATAPRKNQPLEKENDPTAAQPHPLIPTVPSTKESKAAGERNQNIPPALKPITNRPIAPPSRATQGMTDELQQALQRRLKASTKSQSSEPSAPHSLTGDQTSSLPPSPLLNEQKTQ